MRRIVQLSSAVFALTASALAHADDGPGKCPPGAWFCTEGVPPEGDAKKPSDASAGAGNQQGGTTVIINNQGQKPPAAQESTPAAPPPPPPVIVQPAPYYEPPPPPRAYSLRSEWGFNTHLNAALMGTRSDQASNAGMGGIGFSLRMRPTGHFAVDFGLDFLAGRDYQGLRRTETPFTVNALLFLNPRDRGQVYFLGGFGWSAARVQADSGPIAHYDYFGVQGGVGFEYRVARKVALSADVLGFVRGRTDEGAASNFEFVDGTGRHTNTSGGGLFRGGVTFYW